MNREDIIRIAHESHLDVYGLGKDYAKFADALERFYNIAVSAEREACAKVCDDLDKMRGYSYADKCAAHIRARGQA